MSRLLWLGHPTFVLISLSIAFKLNQEDPMAQMDEQCHIPQATLYCDGIYDEWDPKLTTLPGLYIFSVGGIKLLQLIMDIPCSVFAFRMFSLIVNSLSFICIHYIVSHYHSFICEWKRMLITLTLAIFPLNYFYTFLYYTDPLATLFTLVMHIMWIRKSYNISALAGFLAVLTRQTSIVWVAFHGVLTIEKIYKSETNNNSIHTMLLTSKSKNYGKNLQFNDDFITVYSKLAKHLLINTAGYLSVGLVFIIFVIVNNGIVVGDKKNHTVNANFPQMLYFALFTGILTFPHLIHQSKRISEFAFSNKKLTISIFVFNIFIVSFNTVGHHYNLTDVHHYTHHFLYFVYFNSLYALCLVPLYTICSLYIIENSIRSSGKFITAVFIFVLALNLVPQLLLEFRYFAPGFFLFRMRLITTKWKVLLTEFAICFIINAVTLWVYIVRPTLFPYDERQIIMWGKMMAKRFSLYNDLKGMRKLTTGLSCTCLVRSMVGILAGKIYASSIIYSSLQH